LSLRLKVSTGSRSESNYHGCDGEKSCPFHFWFYDCGYWIV